MIDLYITGVQGAAAVKWLQLAKPVDGVSLSDLLGVSENAPDPSLPAKTNARLQRLQAIESQAAGTSQTEYVAIAKSLQQLVRSAAEILGDPKRRQEYLQSLLEARKAQYQQAIQSRVQPGRPLLQPETEALLAVADQYRLDRGEAKRIITRLIGGGDNPYSAFGVLTAPEDPVGCTCFDILCLNESITDEKLIRAQIDRQTQLAHEKESKTTEQDRKRQAREYAQKVQEAQAVLLSADKRQNYLRQINAKRQAKFREEVKISHAGGAVSHDVIIRLLATARRLRLRDADARQTITEVTGFADYMSLLGERKSPALGQIDAIKFDVRDPQQAEQLAATMVIRNDGTGVLSGRITTGTAWLQAEPGSFRTQSSQSVKVTLNPEKLPRGVPVAGQLMVDSNGGTQIVMVEAVLGAGELPDSNRERVIGGLIYLLGMPCTFVLPMVMVFVYQAKSRFLTSQAAQAAVLDVILLAVLLGYWLLVLGIGLKLLSVPVYALMIGIVAANVACAVAVFSGKQLKIPVAADYAKRFA
jgi:curved DNA-binding protein CbpA/uncharacterized membrane protein